MIKIISYFLQTIIIYISFFVGRIFGLKISRIIYSYLFSIIGPKFKSKKIIKNNLKIFSNTTSILNHEEIIKKMWMNYGMTFIEYIFLDRFRKSNSHIFIKKTDYISNLITKKENAIFISGHFANFELMSMEITKKNIPLATIYRPLNNFFLNPLMEYLRKKYVCKNQIKKGINGVRDAIEFIKNKHSIALMIDQRVSEGEKIDFFEKPALTTTLPAQLSIKYNLKIIPVYIERDKNNNFNMEFQKEIDPANFKNKIELTRELNTSMEKMIKRNPTQWIWSHNRWK